MSESGAHACLRTGTCICVSHRAMARRPQAEKSEKEIQSEIQAIIRQVCVCAAAASSITNSLLTAAVCRSRPASLSFPCWWTHVRGLQGALSRFSSAGLTQASAGVFDLLVYTASDARVPTEWCAHCG